MKTVYFNFNNEVDVIELNLNEETEAITVPGQEELTFESIDSFAEQYAQARDVHPNNLKNWKLTKNGETYVFALRAATGGVAAEDINFTLDKVLGDLSKDHHTLDIQAIKAHLHNQEDIVEALVNYEDRELSKEVYDALDAENAFDVEEEEVDTRSDIEILLDNTMETVGTLVLFAKALNLPIEANKKSIMEQAELLGLNNYQLNDRMTNVARTLQESTGAYDYTVLSAFTTQKPEGVVDQDVGDRLNTVATFAGRDTTNIQVVRIGKQFIKKSNKRVPMNELEGKDIRLVQNQPSIFEFTDQVDEEVKEEMKAKREEEGNVIIVHNEDFNDSDEFYDFDELNNDEGFNDFHNL